MAVNLDLDHLPKLPADRTPGIGCVGAGAGTTVEATADILDRGKLLGRLRIELSDGNSSALVTNPDDNAFKYVVMPMRI